MPGDEGERARGTVASEAYVADVGLGRGGGKGDYVYDVHPAFLNLKFRSLFMDLYFA